MAPGVPPEMLSSTWQPGQRNWVGMVGPWGCFHGAGPVAINSDRNAGLYLPFAFCIDSIELATACKDLQEG